MKNTAKIFFIQVNRILYIPETIDGDEDDDPDYDDDMDDSGSEEQQPKKSQRKGRIPKKKPRNHKSSGKDLNLNSTHDTDSKVG